MINDITVQNVTGKKQILQYSTIQCEWEHNNSVSLFSWGHRIGVV